MLDQFQIWPQIRERIRGGPLAEHVDNYLSMLTRGGYSSLGVRRHLRGLDLFGAWLSQHSISVEAVDEATVERFAEKAGRVPSPRSPRGRLRDAASCARGFAKFLWSEGVARKSSELTDPTEADGLLRYFDDHLQDVKGLTPGTRRLYLRYARSFAREQLAAGESEWSAIRPDDIVGFVQVQASRLKPSASRSPGCAMRALLRFLALEGLVPIQLVRAVPTIRQWKHASLPVHLSPTAVEQILSLTKDPLPVRRRDYAILLLLARLALRASEVAALELVDIDWQEGLLGVRATKSKRERRLPISREVGDALVDYLRHGRPAYQHPCVFLRAVAPDGPLSSAAVTAIAKLAFKRADLTLRGGAHVLRHTAATQMVRRGATFKEIADVLGHARIETTTIYAKLDVESLAEVALPWPGGAR